MRIRINSKKEIAKSVAPLRGNGGIPVIELMLYARLVKDIARAYKLQSSDVRFLMIAGLMEGRSATTITLAAGLSRTRVFPASDNLLRSGYIFRKEGKTGHASRGLYLSDMGKEVINEMERVWDDLLRRYQLGQA